jgi:hypothetical protein
MLVCIGRIQRLLNWLQNSGRACGRLSKGDFQVIEWARPCCGLAATAYTEANASGVAYWHDELRAIKRRIEIETADLYL